MIFDHELAWTDEKIYKEIYKNSISNPDEFWEYHSKIISWKDELSNVCYNCIDRHSIETPNKKAIIWYGDEVEDRREISYKNLLQMIIEMASILRNRGVSKGDVVGIYMPTRIESIALMLACARIGAVHMVVFAGFSGAALAYRLDMANAKVLVGVNSFKRGGREINLKDNIEDAMSKMSNAPELLMFDDYKLHLDGVTINDDIEWCSDKDNLFILYTSGSTGKPKGIIHSSLKYMLYTATTFKFMFGAKKNDVYFCTSDIGWITGHSYIAYAPFVLGTTVVIFEGTPTYPTVSRYWEIIEREKVNIFYTSPTAIRSLKLFNESFVKKHDLSSLRVLGSVGEPINVDAWNWYFNVVGGGRCPIIDTWWQTETGGVMISPLLDAKSQKPGFAAKPFFGVVPKIIDNKLYIENKWPG
ncbi:MAG: acetyl-coenzyme A synthetase, partial [Sphingobacteriia bacterium]|nr:acetyl-coenzyme A synthetase [Sphingobacteriia bacterium]